MGVRTSNRAGQAAHFLGNIIKAVNLSLLHKHHTRGSLCLARSSQILTNLRFQKQKKVQQFQNMRSCCGCNKNKGKEGEGEGEQQQLKQQLKQQQQQQQQQRVDKRAAECARRTQTCTLKENQWAPFWTGRSSRGPLLPRT